MSLLRHDDVIKWKHFPRYWPFVRGIHRSPVNSPHKGQWRGALMFSLICVWINGWVKNGEAGDLRRYRAHYDVTVMVGWCLDVLRRYLDEWHPVQWCICELCGRDVLILHVILVIGVRYFSKSASMRCMSDILCGCASFFTLILIVPTPFHVAYVWRNRNKPSSNRL